MKALFFILIIGFFFNEPSRCQTYNDYNSDPYVSSTRTSNNHVYVTLSNGYTTCTPSRSFTLGGSDFVTATYSGDHVYLTSSDGRTTCTPSRSTTMTAGRPTTVKSARSTSNHIYVTMNDGQTTCTPSRSLQLQGRTPTVLPANDDGGTIHITSPDGTKTLTSFASTKTSKCDPIVSFHATGSRRGISGGSFHGSGAQSGGSFHGSGAQSGGSFHGSGIPYGHSYRATATVFASLSSGASNSVGWYALSANVPVPANVLYAGNEDDGSHSYVGRCEYHGGITIGKYIPRDKTIIIDDNGQTVTKDCCEILVVEKKTVRWVRYAGSIPSNAIKAGTSNGSSVYIGRTKFNGGVNVGNIKRSSNSNNFNEILVDS